MKRSAHLTGMQGVYLAAAKLCEHCWVASPTSRSARGADIIATAEDCTRAICIQVKTNRGREKWWLVGPHASKDVSEQYFYVFVNLNDGSPEFFVVPSAIVAKHTEAEPTKGGYTWYSYSVDETYRDRWDLLASAIPA